LQGFDGKPICDVEVAEGGVENEPDPMDDDDLYEKTVDRRSSEGADTHN
jgi:hypothetical protein